VLRRQDVGHRIVVRRVVGVRAGRTLFSDALGELTELTETHLTLITATGPQRVPLAEVHRAKRVPAARRPTAAAVVALELAADEAWPAPVRERLGGWLLRSAQGFTGRANSALPVGDPDRPLEAAIDAVEAWYAERGQPALINVPLPLAAPVSAALDERGWGTARPLVLVQTAPLATILAAAPARPELPAVELAAEPSAGWLAVAADRKAGLPEAARHVLTAVDQVRFAHVYAEPAGPDPTDRELLAIGRGTLTGNGRWLGLTLMEVTPPARRRGLARHVVRGLAEWAGALGASRAFLQVEESNPAAVTLYRGLGFTTHHTYLTRSAPES
jgi:GNAT superfamily N-acetyltransferase